MHLWIKLFSNYFLLLVKVPDLLIACFDFRWLVPDWMSSWENNLKSRRCLQSSIALTLEKKIFISALRLSILWLCLNRTCLFEIWQICDFQGLWFQRSLEIPPSFSDFHLAALFLYTISKSSNFPLQFLLFN